MKFFQWWINGFSHPSPGVRAYTTFLAVYLFAHLVMIIYLIATSDIPAAIDKITDFYSAH